MTDAEIHEAFERLRPICVQLTREHNRANVTKLREALIGVKGQALQQLQEYILFPLRLILKQSAVKLVIFFFISDIMIFV